MDVPSAVLVFLLIAQAAGGPVRRDLGDMNKSSIQEAIQKALQPLNTPQFPDVSCASMNITEPISMFSHCPKKLVELIQGLKDPLLNISQKIKIVMQPASVHAPAHNCTFPSFEQQLDKYLYIKCLLQHLSQSVSNEF